MSQPARPAAAARPRRRLRAFTLIELVVVIVILGILASIGAVSYKAVLTRSQSAALTMTGQQFLNEAQALAAAEQADPVTVVAAAAADLPTGWTHTQGGSEARKVRLNRADGAWICVMLPTSYTQNGFVSGVGLDAADAPAVDACPVTPLAAAAGGSGAQIEEPTPTPSQTPTPTQEPTPEPTVSVAPLAAPTDLAAVRTLDTVNLTWTAVEGASSYRVLRDGATVATTTMAAFTDTSGVSNASAYTYQVLALDGDRSAASAQMPVAPMASSWATVSVVGNHTVALTTTGKLYTWGAGSYGQLGNGLFTDSGAPVQVRPDLTWASASAGGDHTAAITTDGKLFTWGRDTSGQLGDGGTNTNRATPTQIRSDLQWASVSASTFNTAAITTDGRLFTWGSSTAGQVGDGGQVNRAVPTQIRADLTWAEARSGYMSVFALTSSGKMFTWGDDSQGQLGDGGTNTNSLIPVAIRPDLTFKSVDGAYQTVVAITTDGDLYTWGYGAHGQLAVGTNANSTVPMRAGVGTTWRTAAAGDGLTVAVSADGKLFTAGSDWSSRLGDGGTDVNRNTFAQIRPDLTWAKVSAGGTHAGAVTTTGHLFTWGGDSYGQLGNGTPLTNSSVPVEISLP